MRRSLRWGETRILLLISNLIEYSENKFCDDDDGWLSEGTADDLSRLGKRRVWIVDPLDGTREFIKAIP